MTITERNIVVKGKHKKSILLDYSYQKTTTQKPVVVFAHGFKGFKDWGHFNQVMDHFVMEGFVFVKFNFSHNGGTIEDPIDFPDLTAFGNNNYTKELDDLKTVVDWVENNLSIPDEEINKQQIYLIGHSRGGGISIIAANEDKRIKKLVTWAAVSDFIQRLPQNKLPQWKREGVIYIENARTHQQMPMYYQFVQDLLDNKERLNIKSAAQQIVIPFLIIHGTKDEAVSVDAAHLLYEWSNSAKLFLVEESGHTFGGKHPFIDNNLPKDVDLVLEKTIAFLKE
ncbi:MAG: alpha/beta fold hydrolase [Vicingus serpentipes]|nr:alpha/beta fold hydrolase [Vicingus serpentipes]